MSLKITQKQEKFVQAYIETGNASEAYRQAYDCKATSVKTSNEAASRLLKKSKVSARVVELRAQHVERHNITVDSLTLMLKDDRDLARKNDEASAAITAVMSIAKLHGLVVERINATNRHHHTAEPVSAYSKHLADVLGIGSEREAPSPLPN